MLPPDRVAAAEYAKRRVLADVTETWFGTFVHDASHDERAAATQFLDARLPSEHGDDPPTDPGGDRALRHLLDRMHSLYDRHDFDHRVVAGVDGETFARLAPVLRERGYQRELYWALVAHLVDAPAPATPPHLEIGVHAHGTDDARTVHESVGRDAGGITYVADVAGALDGRELVARRAGRPVGAAGWYVHAGDDDPVARLTHVGVRPEVQGEGVGSALVRAVVDRCPLPRERIVVCATAEHAGFYEQLGFVRNNSLWRFARLP